MAPRCGKRGQKRLQWALKAAQMLPQDAQMAPQRLATWSEISAKIRQELMIKFDKDFYPFFIRCLAKRSKISADCCLIFFACNSSSDGKKALVKIPENNRFPLGFSWLFVACSWFSHVFGQYLGVYNYYNLPSVPYFGQSFISTQSESDQTWWKWMQADFQTFSNPSGP